MLRHNFSAVDDEAAKAHAKRYVDGHDVEVWQLDHDHPARPMHMTDSPAFKFVDNLRPPCSKCGRPLVLTQIEPEELGFDLRTYYCAACEDTEFVVAAI
jgi:hypothetical protein